MKLKNIGKSILALGLATTMVLSAPMAVFAANEPWEDFVVEAAGLFTTTESKDKVAEALTNLGSGDSAFENLYADLVEIAPAVIAELKGKTDLNLESLTEIVELVFGETVTADDLNSDSIIAALEVKKEEIKGKTDILKAKSLLTKVNTAKKTIVAGDFGFLENKNNELTVGDTAKLKSLLGIANVNLNLEGENQITEKIVKDILVIFNSKSSVLKADILKAAKTYKLMVTPDDNAGGDDNTGGDNNMGGGTSTPSGGGGSTSNPSKDAQKDIAAAEKKLTEKDADVSAIVESILKDIAKLDTAGAKAVSKTIIPTLADIINKAEGVTNKKAAQDAIVKVVQALVNRVTTQEVEVKDGKATLSASKVKEQIKDAQDMIAQLNKELEKKEIQVTKTVKVTLSFEIDKELAEVEVVIPEGLWKAIDKKANLAVRAKGVELTLEHNTFAEEAYAINVKEEDGLVELTTTGTFTQPIVVTFSVDKKVTNYPTVFQVIGEDDKLVGGTYNAETGTIKVSLKHFSFYTVKENAPKAFTDISGLTWEKKAVNELSARGYLAGMTENTFVPHANTTRAEFAAMLTRVLPVAEVEGELNFTDLKEDAWYYKSIETAVNQGWLVGRENNKFDPAAQITRQEVASVLSRILEQKGYLQTADVEEGVNVVAWAKDAVSLYLREVETKEITELDMSQAATRAELAAMIYQVMAK